MSGCFWLGVVLVQLWLDRDDAVEEVLDDLVLVPFERLLDLFELFGRLFVDLLLGRLVVARMLFGRGDSRDQRTRNGENRSGRGGLTCCSNSLNPASFLFLSSSISLDASLLASLMRWLRSTQLAISASSFDRNDDARPSVTAYTRALWTLLWLLLVRRLAVSVCLVLYNHDTVSEQAFAVVVLARAPSVNRKVESTHNLRRPGTLSYVSMQDVVY